MKNNLLSKHLTNARFFFFTLITLFIAITADQLSATNFCSHILMDIPHTFLRDVFLINYTFMGDTIFALGVITLLYFHWKNKDFAVYLFCSFIITVITIQLLKNFFHAGSFIIFIEPGTTFLNNEIKTNSFSPSMHAAIAFLMATSLVMQFKLSKFLQLSVLFTAIGITCSRVYLAHHLVPELMVGALLGSFNAMLVCFIRAGILTKLFHALYKKSQKTNAGQMMPA